MKTPSIGKNTKMNWRWKAVEDEIMFLFFLFWLKSELVWKKERIMGWWKERKKVEWREMIEEKSRSPYILFR